MFELFDGEENPYGSINNVELAEGKLLKEESPHLSRNEMIQHIKYIHGDLGSANTKFNRDKESREKFVRYISSMLDLPDKDVLRSIKNVFKKGKFPIEKLK